MVESDIKCCAAILAAGLIAKRDSQATTASDAVKIFREVVAELRKPEKVQINSNFHL